ncbi:MAG: hypothetical protein ABI689_04710 [Thermoanaerobaculia bacterium]
MTASGGGLACWQTSRTVCRQFSASGNLGAGEIIASSRPYVFGQNEYEPRLAYFPNLRAMVVWIYAVSWPPEYEDYDYSVEGRLLDAEGKPTGEVFRVATLGGLDYASSSVAALGNDRALVVWSDTGGDGSGRGIMGQIVTADGALVGAAFKVNSYWQGDQRLPDVDADLSGNAVVVWESLEQDGSLSGIYGQRFDRDGQRLGGEFQVSSNAPSDQTYPSVAVDSFGNFVVAFESFHEENDLVQDVFVRAYDADGTPSGEQVRVNEQIIYEQSAASIDLTDTGLLQVAYQSWRSLTGDPNDYAYDIMTRRLVLPCREDATTLCLQGGRFQVRALWRDYAARLGTGRALDLAEDSGGFWFFEPGNFELLVKLVDGCGFNGRYWIFASGLTDVDVDLLVTDTWTGEVELFENALGVPFSPVQEIDLFDSCDVEPPGAEGKTTPPGAGVRGPTPTLGGECLPDTTTHCLGGGRFRVRSEWQTFTAASGVGMTAPAGDDSGLFWFFEPQNLELAVKVIDGCSVNDRFWVYAAGLTNLGVSLTVEDLARDTGWSFENPLGVAFPAVLDANALATCP